MKRCHILMSLVAAFAAVPVLGQAVLPPILPPSPVVDPSQVVVAFTGGSVWTSGSTGTCIWYFPAFGTYSQTSLFAGDSTGRPVVDKQHAYFIWVSDWVAQSTFTNRGFGGSTVTGAVVPPGKATVYFTNDPLSRDWRNINDRSTWGIPIATFTRGGGIFHSPDNFQVSDKFFFSAKLVSSMSVTLRGGAVLDFRSLMPHGMNCFEFGQSQSTTETGSCTVLGN